MNVQEELERAVEQYIKQIRAELHARWKAWKTNLEENEVHEVVGALIARQVTLAAQLAENPPIWNGHVAPVLLRTMVDTYITLAWILKDPLDRARKFILYGLGQEKLKLEHLKSHFEEMGNAVRIEGYAHAR